MFVIRLSEASVFRSILRGPDDFESTRFSCTYYYDLGRGRENKKYFKLSLNENHYNNKTTVCSVIHTSSNSYLVSKQK